MHVGYYKWATPNVFHTSPVEDLRNHSLRRVGAIENSHSPFGTLFQNLPQGVYGFEMEQPYKSWVCLLYMRNCDMIIDLELLAKICDEYLCFLLFKKVKNCPYPCNQLSSYNGVRTK